MFTRPCLIYDLYSQIEAIQLKVLHVYKDYYPPVKGGIENHLNLLANGLMSNGVDVQVLVSNVSNQFLVDSCNGILVAKVPQFGRVFSAPLTPTFYFYLNRFGKTADIIHFHHPNPTAELSYLFTHLNKKMIITYHSDIIRQNKLGKLYSPFRRMFLESADRIIAASSNYIQTSKVLKNFTHKCTVIPYGIDVDRFNGSNKHNRIEQIKKENGNKPLILFVGRFRYYKGLQFLIPAIKHVPANLLLIGTGPEEHRLRKLVKTHRLSDKVYFLGELSDDDVDAYYKSCDIFVLPSHLRSEAFGIVQLEAMCCRKPVISTELGTGTSFVNLNQKTGITVKPYDVDDLSQAMNFLLQHPEKRILYGENGFKRVEELFTVQKMVNRTIELYQEVIRN